MNNKFVHYRVSQKEHEELKQIALSNNVDISKISRCLAVLFLHDFNLKERVLKEVQYN